MFRECSLRVAAFAVLSALAMVPVAASAQSALPSARKPAAAANKESPAGTTTAVRPARLQLEPKAIDVLKAVRARLAGARTLSVVAVETVKRVNRPEGPLVSVNRSEVTLQRPDKLRVSVSGGGTPRSESYCNGNTMMTYSPDDRALVIEKAPPTINECLKRSYQASAIDFPLVDLIVGNPSRDLTSGLTYASYGGQSQAVGETNTDLVTYSGGNMSVQMWVGTQDKLPRLIQVVDLDESRQLRRSVVLSNWKIDVPVRPEVFTSLNADRADHTESAEPRPVGTSGVQPAQRDRPLTLYTYSAKYWGSTAPVAGPASAYGNNYGAGGYYQSPDGYTYYSPANSGYYPPATAGYYGAPCYDCDYRANQDTADDSADGFNISLSTSGWYNPGVPPGYYQPVPANQTNLTYEPGQIVTTLPVGCAAYTRGAAFYLCGSTWFSGVYGPNGELYFRVISAP
jgi:hypothetical protein